MESSFSSSLITELDEFTSEPWLDSFEPVEFGGGSGIGSVGGSGIGSVGIGSLGSGEIGPVGLGGSGIGSVGISPELSSFVSYWYKSKSFFLSTGITVYLLSLTISLNTCHTVPFWSNGTLKVFSIPLLSYTCTIASETLSCGLEVIYLFVKSCT